MDINNMIKTLEKAQNTYGYARQVSVAAEELCELAVVCNRYARYDTYEEAKEALREKIVEETADVCIMLQHLYMIFNVTPEEQQDVMEGKLERLERWMSKSDSLVQSTIDREVKPKEVR